MPSIILSDNGVSSGSAGLKTTASNDGALVLQTTTAGGVATTAVTIGTDQSVTFAGAQTYTGGATFTSGITVQGLTVGKGAGSVSTNTAVGASALAANTSGSDNASFGYGALALNTTGTYNSAFGRTALYATTTGSANTAFGRSALENNTTASNNTAVGYQAGYSQTTGGGNAGQNVFIGDTSGLNTTSDLNTFVGRASGYLVTTGRKNTIIGGYNGNQGGLDIRTSNNFIVLSDGDGNPRARWDNNGQGFTVGGGNGSYAYQILNGGNSTPYGLYMQFTGASPNNTSQYFLACADSTAERFRIYSNGTYGSVSDARLKKNIETSRGYLSDLCQLRVVKYGWNTNDDSVPKELGFIAQEVEEVFPSLVDNSGEYKMIKQPVLIPMLVKAIQELKAEFDAYKEAHP